jgi:sulfur-oxidizing protein SoxY
MTLLKLTRRDGLRTLGVVSLFASVRLAVAQSTLPGLAEAVRAVTGGAPLRDGGLVIEIAELVENGNAVPLRLALSPQPGHAAEPVADPVLRLLVLSERNPAREVIDLRWPAGWPAALPVATRIRLATSQQLVALAQARSGRWWQARADVIVTLAACVEG